MRVAFFEDAEAEKFHPLSLARPVFELVCGRYSLRERIVGTARRREWGVFVREHLAETYREAHPEAHVNDFVWLGRGADTGDQRPLAPLGRRDSAATLPRERAAIVDGRVAFMTLEPFDAPLVMRDGWDAALLALAQRSPLRSEARGRFRRTPVGSRSDRTAPFWPTIFAWPVPPPRGSSRRRKWP